MSVCATQCKCDAKPTDGNVKVGEAKRKFSLKNLRSSSSSSGSSKSSSSGDSSDSSSSKSALGQNDQLVLKEAFAFEREVEAAGGAEEWIRDRGGEKMTLLLFFRGAFCPICSQWIKDYSQWADALADLGVSVVGLGSDPMVASAVLRERWKLAFPLLGDPRHELARKYGCVVKSNKSQTGYEHGVHQPGVVLLSSDGDEVLYQWALTRRNVLRPSPKKVRQTILELLAQR